MQSSIILSVGERFRVNARMNVGQVSETVEVSGIQQALQTDVSTLQSVVGERTVEELIQLTSQ